jgi:hypothetical protein
MKYINTYKLFESNSNSEDMLDEVEDMLLDLYDKDYKIQKSVQSNRNSYNWSVPSYKTQQFTDVESDEEVSAPQDYTHPLDNFSLFNIYIKNGWTSGDTRAARGALRGPRSNVEIGDVEDVVIQIHNYVKSKGYEVDVYFGVNYSTQSGTFIAWDPERIRAFVKGDVMSHYRKPTHTPSVFIKVKGNKI